jgi:hypothetical protein
LEGAVESEFIWPTILGEHVLPFRILPPADFVLPFTSKGEVLDPSGSRVDRWPGLATWIREADALWRANQEGKLTLVKQINHMRKLSQQAPMPATRVVYNKSGMHVAAATVFDPRVVVENGLYWTATASRAEASFLVGILNTPNLTDLARPYMSYGKDERDVAKSIWKLPIPLYDSENSDHVQVVALSEQLALEVAELEFPSSNFVAQRRAVRAHLATSVAGKELNALVADVVTE